MKCQSWVPILLVTLLSITSTLVVYALSDLEKPQQRPVVELTVEEASSSLF